MPLLTPSRIRAITAACARLGLSTECEVLGTGTFSVVIRATQIESGVEVAVKLVHAVSNATAYKREVQLQLACARGVRATCVLPVLFVTDFADTPLHGKCIGIITPYIKATEPLTLLRTCTVADIRAYMRCLLTALSACDRVGVVHRDVKPRNFLYDASTQRGYLTDFGLADMEAEIYRAAAAADAQARKAANAGGAAATALPHYGAVGPTRLRSNDRAGAVVTAALAAGAPGAPSRRTSSHARSHTQTHTETQSEMGKRPRSNGNGSSGVPSSTDSRKRARGGRSSDGAFDADLALFRNCTEPVMHTHTHTHTHTMGHAHAHGYAHAQTLQARAPPGVYDEMLVPLAATASRRSCHADRAGTPGYRAPEVLLGYPYQTTAIDAWSAGVILASLLTRRHPLLPGRDDVHHLHALYWIFGGHLASAAANMRRPLEVVSPLAPSPSAPLALLQLVPRDRKVEDGFNEAFDLMMRLLACDPVHRIKPSIALTSHPFFVALLPRVQLLLPSRRKAARSAAESAPPGSPSHETASGAPPVLIATQVSADVAADSSADASAVFDVGAEALDDVDAEREENPRGSQASNGSSLSAAE